MTHSCCDAPGLLPVEQAMTTLLSSITPLTTTELLPLPQTLDRVVAQAVVSPINVPNFNNSAMDGCAYRHQDSLRFEALTLVGKVYAGDTFKGTLKEGECVRIMTGAPLPDGADTVQMQENVTVNNNKITLISKPELHGNVRFAGEDISKDKVVLPQGTVLQPAHLGLLASLGIAELNVVRKIKVGLFSTGDELAALGQPLQAGQIYDSNRYFLSALLSRLNVECIDYGCLPDDVDVLRGMLKKAAAENDALITSGGVSVGEADYTKHVLDELGQVNFWKLAIKPGKPFAFGKIANQNKRDTLFFGLPGNPVSAFVTCHQLVVPALHKLSAQQIYSPTKLLAKTETQLRKRPGRMDFQRGYYQVNQAGELTVRSTGAQGSGILTSICQANCYILLAQEQGNIEKDEKVQILPFDKYIN